MDMDWRPPHDAAVLLRRRAALLAFAVTIACAAAAASSPAEALCVNTDGSGGCFTSLEDAFAAAGVVDEIDVAAGTYAEPLLPTIVRKRWTIRGAGTGLTVIQTTFDAQGEATRLRLSDLTVEGSPTGSAVRIGFKARLELERVELRGAETGLERFGPPTRATIVDSTIHSNTGEGIRGGSRLRLSRSLVHSNGSHGLSQFASGDARIEDCTISGNVGSGILLSGGQVRIRGSTVIGSSAVDGGALHVTSGSSARMEASILADETAGVGGLPDLRIDGNGRVRSNGFNLVKDPSVGTAPTGRTDFDIVGVDPLLGPLQDNGGATLTHAPAPASPVLEVVLSGLACRRSDQRGITREPAPCDSGAFEAP